MGQISKPGKPASFDADLRIDELVFEQMPSVDLDLLMAEDEVVDTMYDIPWRFGDNIPVRMNPDNSGKWTLLTNGTRVWRLGIASPGAYSLNLTFDRYHLPPGAELYIYNTDRSFVLGAFTDFNNQEDGYFATSLVPGDSIVVEYIEPPGVGFRGELNLATVTHAYRDPAGFTKAFGQSGWCNLNVACDEALGWEDQIRSVVMLLVGSNAFCSGVMINNTNNDARPFLLSANHCYRNPSTLVVWFNWESETCENPETPPPYDAISGALHLARNAQSDFWLLELNHQVPDTYEPFFAGWNRTLADALTDTVIGIHHPRGDIKKFSYAEGGVQAARYLGNPGSGTTHWHITWDGGTTTEPASSGSPIFDGEGRIIGQLHGGYAACGNTDPDWYGRFGVSWTGGGQPDNSLSHWLDPVGLDLDAMPGFDPVLKYPDDVIALSAHQDENGDIVVVWEPNANEDMVLLGWNTDDVFGQPAGYHSLGDTIRGGGQIMYMGFEHQARLLQVKPGVTYYFRAWSVERGPYYSAGKDYALTTGCPPDYPLPFNEPVADQLMPGCWSQHFIQGAINWRVVGLDNHPLESVVSGDHSLFFKHEGSDAATILASPVLKKGGFDGAVLSFHYANLHQEDGADELAVLIRHEGESDWTLLERYVSDIRQWTRVELELPEGDGAFQIAFEGRSGGGMGILVDAILVEGRYAVAFPPPQNLQVVHQDIDRVTLTWDQPEPNPHAGEQKSYSPELAGYHVYRDGRLIVLIPDPVLTSFEDGSLPADSFVYHVTARYAQPEWESAPSNELMVYLEEETPYVVKVNLSGPGHIWPEAGEYLFNAGASVQFSATPFVSAWFEGWKVNDEVFSTDQDMHLIIDSTKEIEAVFLPEIRKLVLESLPEGSSMQTGSGEYDHGAVVRVATSIPDGWDFLYWIRDEELLSISPAFHFTVEADDTLVAVFSPPLQHIDARVEPPWAGHVNGAGFYPFGDDARLEAVADNNRNFIFSHWAEGGVVVHENPVYMFHVTRPMDLTAWFTEKRYTLEVRVSPEGSGLTTPEKGMNFFSLDERVELIAVPLSGWQVSHWEIDGLVIEGKYAEVVIRDDNLPATAFFEIITTAVFPEDSAVAFQFYPNPARDYLRIDWINDGHQVDLQLLDASGRVMLRQSLPPDSGLQQHIIKLDGFHPGVYILRLVNGQHSHVARVVVY